MVTLLVLVVMQIMQTNASSLWKDMRVGKNGCEMTKGAGKEI